MTKQRDEVVVGIFTLIAIVVAIGGTLWLARRGFSKSYNEYTRFAWGQNVKPGQPVNLAGVQVGYVDAVELDETGFLNVRLSIDKGRKIPSGTTATVTNEGFFGDKSISLTPCTASPAPVSADTSTPTTARPLTASCRFNGFLTAGDTIPAGRAAPSMDMLLMRVDSVSSALSDVAKTVKIEFVQQGGIQDLRKTIASTNTLVQQLNTVAAEQSRGLTLTMNALRSRVTAIDSISLDSTVRNMQSTTRNLSTLTSNLDSTTRKLNAVMTQLQTGDGTAAKFLNDPGVYNNLHELLGRMDSLITDIKANPKRYINVKVF
jgi:phospholipid/cholesterol/gamma-HCH transport system substrate-binding protein